MEGNIIMNESIIKCKRCKDIFNLADCKDTDDPLCSWCESEKEEWEASDMGTL